MCARKSKDHGGDSRKKKMRAIERKDGVGGGGLDWGWPGLGWLRGWVEGRGQKGNLIMK